MVASLRESIDIWYELALRLLPRKFLGNPYALGGAFDYRISTKRVTDGARPLCQRVELGTELRLLQSFLLIEFPILLLSSPREQQLILVEHHVDLRLVLRWQQDSARFVEDFRVLDVFLLRK